MPEKIEEQVYSVERTCEDVDVEHGSWLYRKCVAYLLRINDTPEAVALGVSLGVLIAMTPTVGFQILLVLVVHTIFGANRLAGIAMVYISNPFTVIPIYWLDYVVGTFFLGWRSYSYEAFTERVAVVTAFVRDWEFWSATRELLLLGGDLVVPMFVGGIVLGAVLAAPAYPITLAAVRRHRAARARRQSRPVTGGRHGADD